MSNQKKINNLSPACVLVAPLEWGLGHATRCIPIITELLSQNCEVFIAAEKSIYNVLKIEFPSVNFLLLRGYRIKVSTSQTLFSWKMVSQLPKIFYTIYKENRWLREIVHQYKIDAVISDNRPGLYNKKVKCIYVTHQLSIKTGNIITEKIARQIHYYFIKKYNECWVPDFEKNSLAGELSHPKTIPANVKYIGALSRFEKRDEIKKYELLIMLSGPEPQRTIFERILLNNLSSYDKKALFVRGLPGTDEIIQWKNGSVEIVNHVSGKQLNKAIQQSEIILSRSGYSTIMDLLKLNKSAIVVPTPGQTEQQYLASYLMKKKIFFSVDQRNFNLNQTLQEFKKFTSTPPTDDMEQYKSVILEFVKSLRD